MKLKKKKNSCSTALFFHFSTQTQNIFTAKNFVVKREKAKATRHSNLHCIQQIISLTELMAGVKAPTKTVQLFQLTCWPMGHKVPSSTNSLVELMNMVERWRQRTDYGPVCVVSP